MCFDDNGVSWHRPWEQFGLVQIAGLHGGGGRERVGDRQALTTSRA